MIRSKRVPTVLLLGLAVSIAFVVAYWPLLASPGDYRFFGYADSWELYGPSQYFLDSSLHAGEFPLWNPLLLVGQPIAGNPEYVLFYPPNLIRSLLTFNPTPFRTHVGMAILQWLHVVLAAYGAYWCGRSMSLSKLASAVAGFAFALSSALSVRVFGHQYIVYVVAWWPVLLCCLHRAMHADGARARLRWSLLFGGAFAMSLLGGSPQMTYLSGVGLAVYWLVARADLAIGSVRGAVQGRRWVREIAQDGAVGIIALASAVGISAALLGPSLEFLRYTPRGSLGSAEYQAIPGDAGWNLVDLLAVYPGSSTYEGVKTLSAVALVLCVPAFFSSRSRAAVRLLLTSALLIDASTDNSLFMFEQVLRFAPFPITAAPRGMMIACLPLALLAGHGLDALRDGVPSKYLRAAAIAASLFVGTAATWVMVVKMDAVHFAVSRAAVIPVVVATLAVAAAIRGWRTRVMVVLVAIALFVEPVYWQNRFVRDVAGNAELFFPLGSEVANRRTEFWQGNSRATGKRPNSSMYQLEPIINGYQALYLGGVLELLYPGTKENPFRRGADAYSIARQSDRTFLLLKRSFWLHRQYVLGEIPDQSRAFPPTTTVYLRETPVGEVPQVDALEVPREPYTRDTRPYLVANRPITFTPDSRPTPENPLLWRSRAAVPEEHKTLAIFMQNDVPVMLAVLAAADEAGADAQPVTAVSVAGSAGEVRRVDLPMPDLTEFTVGLAVEFPEKAGSMTLDRVELLVDLADENALIHVMSRTANTVEVEVRDLPGPRILSHIDSRYPGWRAYVDGEEASVLTAFSHFKAVEVPVGTHRVRFEFRPRLVYLSVAVSLVSLATWIAVLAWTFKRPARTNDSKIRLR